MLVMQPVRADRAARIPLSPQRVLQAALALADADGIGALTMRSLAEALAVQPMAIYHHVAGKEQILDGIIDLVFAEITQPEADTPWRDGLAQRAASVRDVLGRHPWAIGLMESRRSPGPATLRHHENAIALLRRAGFSIPAVAHAIAFFDAYVYGFVLQEVSLPFDGPDEVSELAEEVLAQMSVEEYPYFVEFAQRHVMQPGYDFGDEFAIGLTMVLDAIARLPGAAR
jgi:AcrR family transcriptional regulator